MAAGAARRAGGVRGGGTESTLDAAHEGSKPCRGVPRRAVPRRGCRAAARKQPLGSSMELQLRDGERIGDHQFNSIRRVCQQVRQHLTLCRGEIA